MRRIRVYIDIPNKTVISVLSTATAPPPVAPPTTVMASLSASALKAAWRSHQLLPEPVKSNSFL